MTTYRREGWTAPRANTLGLSHRPLEVHMGIGASRELL
jgi:hypothetical protein